MGTTTRFLYIPPTGLLAAVGVLIALAGCATKGPAVFDDEEFTSTNTYSHSFPGSGATVCEAARRALLSQGYIISESKPTFVKGGKNFQRSRDSHAELEFTVVCAVDSAGSNATTIFANAVRQSYSLKKSSNSASVGVGVLGSLSVPFGLSDDAMVKVGAQTIVSKKFYDQFFASVETYVDTSEIDPVDAPSDKPAPVSPDLATPAETKSETLRAEALKPAVPPGNPANLQYTEPPPLTKHPMQIDLHFLIVNDSVPMRHVVMHLLKELGYRKISEAVDGAMALRACKNAKLVGAPVDFIITDCDMPVMNGLDLIRAIRASADSAELPILMVTPQASRDNILAAAEAGTDGYIVRPFNANALERKLESILAAKGSAR